MVSTFTPNINLEEPARGDDVGTWDTPVNGNMTLTDLVVGGTATISLNNSPVVLAAAQFQARNITFNSTLTGSVAITFPSTFKKDYIIRHTCTGSSAFTITLQTTVAGGQVVACRPGNPFHVYNDGTNLYFVNLGTEIGGYWDYVGSSMPNWVSACTVPPYLNCDGSTFSAATFPTLAVILGSTTLPDSRGRSRFALDQSAGRLSSGTTGMSSVGTGGGAQTVTISASNVPSLSGSNSISVFPNGSAANFVPSDTTGWTGQNVANSPATSVAPLPISLAAIGSINTFSGTNTITVNSTTGGPVAMGNVPPGYIGGLTLIRAG